MVAGQPVSDSQFIHALEHVDAARNGVVLTYFEWLTLAALWVFKQADLDVILRSRFGGV